MSVILVENPDCCCNEGLECDGYCVCTPQTISVTFTGIQFCACKIRHSRFDLAPPGGCSVGSRWTGAINTTYPVTLTEVDIFGNCHWCSNSSVIAAYLETECNDFDCENVTVKDLGIPVVDLIRIGTTQWSLAMYFAGEGPNGPFFDRAYLDQSIIVASLDCEPTSLASTNELTIANCSDGEESVADVCDAVGDLFGTHVMAYGGSATITGSC